MKSLVYLIDDDDSVRKAVARLLAAAGYEVRSYANAVDFLLESLEPVPACLILDVRMPGPSGLELQAALTRRGFNLPIIFLTGHGDIRMSVQAMKAGASDFLTKPVEKHQLLTAVNSAIATQVKWLEKVAHQQALEQKFAQLNIREKQVLSQVIQGKLNKQIAAALGLAERTVKAHRANLMEKLGVGSVAELVRLAEQLERPTKAE
jgi:FixJ family two-component response regulator